VPTQRPSSALVTYPEGDPAREDDYIRETTARWNARVTWIDSETVTLFEHLATRVAVRDDPYAHTFEAMNLRLAATSASIGARAALDGYGGDQLFHVSGVFLADYFARLRWRELRLAMREMRVSGPRAFISHVVVPWLPDGTREWLDRVRGRDVNRGTMIRQSLPSWLSPHWALDEQLAGRAALEPRRRLLESPSAYESRWYVETPYFPRASAWAASLALQAGVVVRSPLLDRRVLEFAASRPLSERVSPFDTKLLLKEAVRDLIPETVLAPRPFKTGIPRGYLARQMERSFSPMFREVFSTTSRLSTLGVVDASVLASSVSQLDRSPDHITRVQLFLTLQAELWVRSIENPLPGRL
jgi:Asparagine synthase